MALSQIPDDGKLDKDQTSYDNVLDAFRLALKVISLVKKELTRYKESQDSDSHFLSNRVAKIDIFETYFLYVVHIVDFVKSDK